MEAIRNSPSFVKQGKENERIIESISSRMNVWIVKWIHAKDLSKAIEKKEQAIADYCAEWKIDVRYVGYELNIEYREWWSNLGLFETFHIDTSISPSIRSPTDSIRVFTIGNAIFLGFSGIFGKFFSVIRKHRIPVFIRTPIISSNRHGFESRIELEVFHTLWTSFCVDWWIMSVAVISYRAITSVQHYHNDRRYRTGKWEWVMTLMIRYHWENVNWVHSNVLTEHSRFDYDHYEWNCHSNSIVAGWGVSAKNDWSIDESDSP